MKQVTIVRVKFQEDIWQDFEDIGQLVIPLPKEEELAPHVVNVDELPLQAEDLGNPNVILFRYQSVPVGYRLDTTNDHPFIMDGLEFCFAGITEPYLKESILKRCEEAIEELGIPNKVLHAFVENLTVDTENTHPLGGRFN